MEILEAPCRRLVAGHCCAEERAPRRVPRYSERASTIVVLACESARSAVHPCIHSRAGRAVQLRGQQQQWVPEVLDWLRLVGAAEGEC
jgi:hypothetical protein